MNGKKLKIPNILKKELDVIHIDDIGNQPAFNTPKPVKIKKKPLPVDKDLFYKNNNREQDKKKKSYSKKKKPPMVRLLESMNQIDITSNAWKREQKMR